MKPSFEILPLVQGTPEWLEARRRHITASQVPVLFNASPYQKPQELLEEKLTGIEKEVSSFQQLLFQKGHNAEEAAREWLKANFNVEAKPAVLISKKHKILLASLDGHVPEKNMIFEAKYMGEKALLEVREGKIKSHHLLQVQAQLLVSGAEKCIYFAMTDNGEAAIQEILPDEKVFSEIVSKAKEFSRDLKKLESAEKKYRSLHDELFKKYTPERKKRGVAHE